MEQFEMNSDWFDDWVTPEEVAPYGGQIFTPPFDASMLTTMLTDSEILINRTPVVSSIQHGGPKTPASTTPNLFAPPLLPTPIIINSPSSPVPSALTTPQLRTSLGIKSTAMDESWNSSLETPPSVHINNTPSTNHKTMSTRKRVLSFTYPKVIPAKRMSSIDKIFQQTPERKISTVTHNNMDQGHDSLKINLTVTCHVTTTKCNKTSNVSHEALNREMKTKDNVDCDNQDSRTDNSVIDTFGGFTTASGAKVIMKEESLAAAKRLWNDTVQTVDECVVNDEVVVKEKTNVAFMGFQTASGSKVTVSAKALDAARRKMEEDNICVEKEIPPFSGFTTAAGTTVNVSEKALIAAKKLWEDTKSDSSMVSAFGGFTTASGANVHVKEESLRAAKMLWDDTVQTTQESITNVKNTDVTSTVFQTAPQTKVNACAETLTPSRKKTEDGSICKETKEMPPVTFTGFTTASGTKVIVSKEAIESARGRMDDQIKEPQEIPSVTFTGFMTAAGTNVTVSKEDIESARERMDGQIDNLPPTTIAGMSTALESKINSRESMDVPVETSPLPIPEDFLGFIRQDMQESQDRCFRMSEHLRHIQPTLSQEVDDSTAALLADELRDDEPVVRLKLSKDVIKGRKEVWNKQQETIKQKKTNQEKKPTSVQQSVGEKRPSLKEAVGGECPGCYSEEELVSMSVKRNVMWVTASNACDFSFQAADWLQDASENVQGIPLADGSVHLLLNPSNGSGCLEMTSALLCCEDVDPALVPKGWIANHWKWIVWKLAALERSFPQLFAGRALTPSEVFNQLRHRYHRELHSCQRPCLRRILECDDSPAKRMVLYVVRVGTGELELSDGWYSVKAVSDAAMDDLVRRKKVAVGTKLVIHGAHLVGGAAGGWSPLEIPEGVHLRISTNCCRRGRWYSRLGYSSCPCPLQVYLKDILPCGGSVAMINVVVARTYPVLFMDKQEEGKTVFRNAKAQSRLDVLRERSLEGVYESVRGEIMKGRKSKQQPPNDLSGINDPEELLNIAEWYGDEVKSVLSPSQISTLECHQESLLQSEQETIEREVKKRIKGGKGNTTTPFFKIRVVDASSDSSCSTSALLAIWKPPEELLQLLTEGRAVKITNLTPSTIRGRDGLRLNTTRQTAYEPIDGVSIVYPKREVTELSSLMTDGFIVPFGEIDTCGLVVKVDKGQQTPGRIIVQLADDMQNVVHVTVWDRVDEEFKISHIVSCRNLYWKGKGSNGVPQLMATDSTIISEGTKDVELTAAMDTLRKAIPDPWKLINELNKCSSVESPLATSTPNQQKRSSTSLNHQSRSSTPLNPRLAAIRGFHCTRTPVTPSPSEEVQCRKVRLLEKYGDPPPLPILTPGVSTRARKKFRMPLKIVTT